MRTIILAWLIVAGSPLPVTPAAAADVPDARGYVTPPVVYAPRVYVLPYCRIETERFFDGYAWRSRDVQVCH
ncbi:MAG: hypothetical protein K2W78_14425 [Xanthobacteraceae bacterium]|nr:hypothetical protein [Xanthobacteraceae bacterium]